MLTFGVTFLHILKASTSLMKRKTNPYHTLLLAVITKKLKRGFL